MRASAPAGLCGNERVHVRECTGAGLQARIGGSERENRQENDKKPIGLIIQVWCYRLLLNPCLEAYMVDAEVGAMV